MAVLGNRRPLEMEDLWELEPMDSSAQLVPRFERIWEGYLKSWRAKHPPPTTTHGMSTIPTGSTLPLNGASETEALQSKREPLDAKGMKGTKHRGENSKQDSANDA